MSQLEQVYSLLLSSSCIAAAMIIVLILIRKLFHIKPRVMDLLWLIVIIKLMIPIAPQSPFSLYQWLPQANLTQWSGQVLHHTTAVEAGEHESTTLISGSDGSNKAEISETNQMNVNVYDLENTSQQQAIDTTTSDESEHTGLQWLTVATIVWLSGFILIIGYYLLCAKLFRHKVRDARLLHNEDVLAIVQEYKRKLGIKMNIKVYESDNIGSPCVYGLLVPKIYVPSNIQYVATTEQITHIMAHELMHIKRRDLWVNALWLLSISLHWYNPLVWLAAQKSRADREIACDAGVLESLGEKHSTSYGMTLLMLTRLFSNDVYMKTNLSHFSNNKKEMKRRITMISKFTKGSYKISFVVILLFLCLGIVLLTKPSTVQSNVNSSNVHEGENDGSFYITRPIDTFKWFHRLDRALDFASFEFKVPDYLPDGYQLQNVELNKLFSGPNDVDLIHVATIYFVTHFLEEDENKIEVLSAVGNGTLLEHNLLWGASYTSRNSPINYKQHQVQLGDTLGTLYTEKWKGKIRKSFVWHEGQNSYAINYDSGRVSQDEVERIVNSFVLPQDIQNIRYNEDFNSYPIYDETDLQRAKQTLGFQVKLPFQISDIDLKLIDSTMLRAGDENTEFWFRQSSDALWNSYHPSLNTTEFNVDDYVTFYQSKEPLFDSEKLTLDHEIEMNGITVSAYRDTENVYIGPIYEDVDHHIVADQIYYMWEQDGIHYITVFKGIESNQDQKEIVQYLLLAPLQ